MQLMAKLVFFDLAYLKELGYNSLRARIEPDYRVEWFDQLKEDKPIEWMRAVLEDMWGRRCRQGCLCNCTKRQRSLIKLGRIL